MPSLRPHGRWRRGGFSLLEMVLALALGMLVLAGLYLALSTQFSQAQAGREVLEEGTLARAILARIESDVINNLGAFDPRTLPTSGTSTLPAADQANTTAQPMNGTTPTDGGVTPVPAEEAGPSMSATPPPSETIQFNFGVRGDSGMLMLAVSQVPRRGAEKRKTSGDQPTGPACDLRRIAYWFVDDGKVTGLARQEVTQVTAGDIDVTPTDLPNQEQYVIAPEVMEASFRYFDGSAWQTSWDGSAPGPDGETPLGPPAAIEVTLKLRFRTVRVGQEDQFREADYTHVIALPTANNFSLNTAP